MVHHLAEALHVDRGALLVGPLAVADGRVFGGHFENQVFCVDLAKGTNLWSYRDRAFAYVSSPAVLGDRLVIGGTETWVNNFELESPIVTVAIG